MWAIRVQISPRSAGRSKGALGEVSICKWGKHKTAVMDYDEACFMHLTPEVVHNFPKAVSV